MHRAVPAHRNVALRARRMRVLLLTATWTAISILLFAYAHFYLVVSAPEVTSSGDYYPGYNLIGFIAVSVLFGLTFGYAMVFRFPKRTRRRSFAYGIVFNTVWLLVVYVAVVLVVTTTISLIAISREGEGELIPSVMGVLTNPGSLITMVLWALMIAATQFVLQVSDKFGQGVLWDFLRGRYFEPVQVERIFMFLDLKSSTTIAEQLGHIRYFEFIGEFIADVTEPIVEHGGEIYQYVGDEVVISWPMLDPQANVRCLACFFACRTHLEGLADRYHERFGVAPQFRAGIHGGAVTAGEIGIVRKEIVFSGDVLNTTARIQAECKVRGVPLIVSANVVHRIDLKDELELETLGVAQLRGRHESVELLTVKTKEG